MQPLSKFCCPNKKYPGFGSEAEVEAAIEASAVSKTINTAFVERHNATERNHNARKVRSGDSKRSATDGCNETR